MAKTYVQKGDVLDHTAAADISSGAVVAMGNIVGVALADIPNGGIGPVQVDGVFTLAKTAATAWAQGDALRWDVSASQFTKGGVAATGDISNCAVAAAVAGSADTTAAVLLRAMAGTVT